ncbi:MAG: hypothetical protein WC325_11135, partial [Candidatus Bathyarchaeia archaeon]
MTLITPLPTMKWENRVITPPPISLPTQVWERPANVVQHNPTQISPLPADPTSPTYAVQGSYVLAGSTVVDAKGTPIGIVGSKTNPPILKIGETYNIVPPQPEQPKPNMVAPTLQNILADPYGVLGTVTQLAGVAADKLPEGIPKTFFNLQVGGYGELANQASQVKNAVGNIGNALLNTEFKANPLPFTPQNEMQSTGQTVFRIGEAVSVAVIAPVVAPAVGVAVPTVLAGEAVGAVLNIVPATNLLVGEPVTLPKTPLELVERGVIGAAQGGVFGLVAGGSYNLLNITGKGLGYAVARTSVDTAQGAIFGTIQEAAMTGKVTGEGGIQGAGFGLAFGALGEVGAYAGGKINTKYDVAGKLERNIPIPKYGDVTVPLEGGGEARYRGIYLSQGSEAKPIFGKLSGIDDGARILSGYAPSSNIDVKVTQDVMAKGGGYTPEQVAVVGQVRNIMGTTQNVKPQTINDVFPTETGTLSEIGTTTVKKFIMENIDNVDMVYGSYATRPQLSESFEYASSGKSALRTPGDIDVQLSMSQKGAVDFAQKLVTRLQGAGADVKISAESPTLIEANVGQGVYAHAVDIHYKGEAPNVLTPSTQGEVRWGFSVSRQPIKIEDVPAMSLTEQGLRKGAAILSFTEEGIGTVSWRAKDAPDFFQVQRTLLEQIPASKTVKVMDSFEQAMKYYNVQDIKASPQTNEFLFYNKRTTPVT